MAFYRNRIYPHIVSMLGNPRPIQKIREQIIPSARGTVLEVGVGPGVNFAYYAPARIEKLYALEPNPGMLKRAENQRRLTELNVEFLDLPGERIPLSEASVDTAVSTFTLCTIPGVADAIRGMSRVLKPDGQFLFLNMDSRLIFACVAGRKGPSLFFNGPSRDAM
jgi:ubiquinone/menaquinone biosynthesis C-methylase UbiE